jgi:hypothetical protein
MDLYNNRYKTLAAHQAAVAARKTLEKGKNIGPVANADAYGSKIKKPSKKAVVSTSTGTNSAKTAASKSAKKATLKTSPTATAKKKATKESRSDGLRNLSKTVKSTNRPNQTKNGASLGSKLSAAEKAKRAKAAASPNKTARGTARGGSRASNNNRGKVQTSKSKGPKVGETRRIRKGSKYVTQGWTGSRWKAVGGKG